MSPINFDGFFETNSTSPFPPVVYNWSTPDPTNQNQYNLSSGVYSFKQTFPSATTETSYKIRVYSSSVGESLLKWDNESQYPDHYTKTLKQYINPVLTLNTDDSRV